MVAPEEVVSRRELDRLGLEPGCGGPSQFPGRMKLVVPSGDEQFRTGIGCGGERGEDAKHRRYADPSLDPGIGHRQRDVGAEAVAGEYTPLALTEQVEHRHHVVALGSAAAVLAGGVTGPAEIEPHRPPPRGEGAVDHGRHHRVVPRSAVEGMGMTDDHGADRVDRRQEVDGNGGVVVDGEMPCLDRGFHAGTVPVALDAVNAENRPLNDDDRLPVKMLNDRILVKLGDAEGERRSSGGILIPATAQVGKRLTWAAIVAVGPNVRNMEPGDQVLFNPEDRYEVEVRGTDYIILRERDIHAVAAERLDEGSTGLYL